MWISRRVYEDLKKEHQRTVEALTAWIESLEAKAGAPTAAVRPPEARRAEPEMAMYMGEDEEALYEAHGAGLINGEQLEEGLKQLGFLNKDVKLEVVN